MTSDTVRRHRVEIQAMVIEQILARYGYPVAVSEGTAGPRSTTFVVDVRHRGHHPSLSAIERQVRATLNVPHVHIGWDRGRLHVEVDEGPGPRVRLLDLVGQWPNSQSGVVPIGLAEDGRPVFLNLFAPRATHILLIGGPDAGKSSLLRSIALSLSMAQRQSEVQMVFVDPAHGTLQPLHHLPHALCAVAQEAEEIEGLFQSLQQEIFYRMNQGIRWPAIIAFVDGLSGLLRRAAAGVESLFADLLRRGIGAGVYLIFAGRDIPSREFSHLLRAHAPDRIVGRVTDRDAALAASGLARTNAEFLLGRGDFVAVNGTSSIRFQASYVDDYDLHFLLEELHRRRRPPLLARAFNVRPRLSPVGIPDDHHFQFAFDGRHLSSWE